MYAGSKALFYALSRSALLKRVASKYGLANACRLILNSNEFMFVN